MNNPLPVTKLPEPPLQQPPYQPNEPIPQTPPTPQPPFQPNNQSAQPMSEEQTQDLKFQEFLKEIGPAIEKYGFNLMTIVAKEFKSARPNIFFRGPAFDCSILLSKVADDFRYEILSQFYSRPAPTPPQTPTGPVTGPTMGPVTGPVGAGGQIN